MNNFTTKFFLLAFITISFFASAQLQLVKEVPNGLSIGHCALTINGITFFSAGDQTVTGVELWRTDGTAAGTYALKDIFPGISDSNPQEFVNLNGTLYFLATTGGTSNLWKSDGTVNGTVQIGSFVAYPPMIAFQGKLIFNSSSQLYSSDGTVNGTTPIAVNPTYQADDFNKNGCCPYNTLTSRADRLTQFNNGIILTGSYNYVLNYGKANTLLRTGQLRFIDNSGQVRPIDYQISSDICGIQAIYASQNFCYFFTNGNCFTDLWRTDATLSGTSKLYSFGVTYSGVRGHVINNVLNFTVGYDLYRTDGSPSGTSKILPSIGTASNDFFLLGNSKYVIRYGGLPPDKIWQSDGVSVQLIYYGNNPPNFITDLTSWTSSFGAGSVNFQKVTSNGAFFYQRQDTIPSDNQKGIQSFIGRSIDSFSNTISLTPNQNPGFSLAKIGQNNSSLLLLGSSGALSDINGNKLSGTGVYLLPVPQDQSVSFNTLTPVTFGSVPFQLTATSSSGLPVTYTSSNPNVATVSGSTVTIVGAGSTVITASQAGNANYNPAPNVQQTLTVNKADQTISFGTLPVKKNTDAPFAISASASSSLTVSFASSNTSVATVSGNTVAIVGVGTTNITASQAGNTNYNAATNVVQVLNVSSATNPILIVTKGGNLISNGATYDFGNVGIVSNSGFIPFAVSNIGTATLTLNIAGSSLTGTNAADFSVDLSALNNPVTSNTIPFGIKFTPSGLGLRTAAISIASNDPTQNPYIVNIQGTGVLQPQTITFNALAAKTYGDAAFNLTATASSGLPVSYTSSDPTVATISGSTVTITGAGSVTITSSQAGNNTTYAAAPNVQQTLTVNPASQTITFSALPAATFGSAPITLSATASSGLPVGYSSSNTSVATVSGNVVTIVGAGATIITASQSGNTNYSAASNVQQTLIINKANQTITFGSLSSATYGGSPITLSGTSTSGLPVSYSSSNTAVATVSGSVVTTVGAGSTIITASQAGDNNYNAAINVQQTLTVNKANQTISFAALSVATFGDAPITLTGTSSSGLALSYSSSNTSVTSIIGNVVTIVGAGNTTITASQTGDTNYNAASNVAQALTVNKANQTITFNALPTVATTDPPFNLTATASSGLAVTYTSNNTNVATVSGNTVTIIGAGTTTIAANQAGNANYNLAATVQQTLTVVTKQNQTISFAPVADVTIGDASFLLNATASSGLSVVFNNTSNKATIVGNQVTLVSAGRDTITATQPGNTFYNAAPSVSQSFCINPAKPTITLSGNNTVSPTLTSSASSGNQWFLNGAAINNATGNTLPVSAAGSYTVQVSADNCLSAMSNAQVIIVTGDITTPPTSFISIYPNPAKNTVSIGFENLEANERVSITIYDLLGRSIATLEHTGGNTISLDVSSYAQGTYLVKVIQASKTFNGRFVKQ